MRKARSATAVFLVSLLPVAIAEIALWLVAWGHIDCFLDSFLRARIAAALIAPPLIYFVFDRLLTQSRFVMVCLRTVGVALAPLFFIAIAYPSLVHAPMRSRQKETMRRMRAIALALDAYAVDKGQNPPAKNIAEANSMISRYGHVEDLDAWCTPFVVEVTPKTYRIISLANDRKRGPTKALVQGTTNFDDDIILADGLFVQSPEGIQAPF